MSALSSRLSALSFTASLPVAETHPGAPAFSSQLSAVSFFSSFPNTGCAPAAFGSQLSAAGKHPVLENEKK